MSSNIKRIWSSIGQRVSSLWTLGEDKDEITWSIEDTLSRVEASQEEDDHTKTPIRVLSPKKRDLNEPTKRDLNDENETKKHDLPDIQSPAVGTKKRRLDFMSDSVEVIPDSQDTPGSRATAVSQQQESGEDPSPIPVSTVATSTDQPKEHAKTSTEDPPTDIEVDAEPVELSTKTSVFASKSTFLEYVYPAKPIVEPKTEESNQDEFYPETVLDTAFTLSCFVPMSCADILELDMFEQIYGKQCEIPLPKYTTGGPFFFRNHPIVFVSCFGRCQVVELKEYSNLLILSLDDSSGNPIEVIKPKDTTKNPEATYHNKFVHIKGTICEAKGYMRKVVANHINVLAQDMDLKAEFEYYREAINLRKNFLSKKWVLEESKENVPSCDDATRQDSEFQYLSLPTQCCVWSQESQNVQLTDDIQSQTHVKSVETISARRHATQEDQVQSPNRIAPPSGDNSSPSHRYLGPKRLF